MTRRITPSTILLGAALIALPASGLAQTPPQQQPPQQQTPPEQPPATPPSQAQPPATERPATQPPATEPAKAHAEHGGSPAEHLAKAKSALNEIEAAAVTGAARARLNELKRHVSALDRAVAGAPETGKPARAKSETRSWATDVAAIDRILTELTTPTTSAADQAAPTGTSGTTGMAGKDRTAAQAVTVDDATRAKLLEVRTHITAFASAMSGTSPAPESASPATSAAQPEPPTTGTPATPPPAQPSTPPTTQPQTNPPTQPQTNPPSTDPQPSTPPQTPPSPTEPQTTTPSQQPPTATPADPAAPAAGNVDPETARRHLTEARDVLSQVAQMPEAAQLTGDTRTQVSQLISNFNELITTQAEWRASYAKVQANLTALIGAERTDEANVPPPATGTAGAVGTSGNATLDPKIREKLIEFRTKLAAFERAAGGAIPK